VEKQVSKNSALVTGGTGYIGSRLVSQLVDMGWKVHVLKRAQSQTTRIDPLENRISISDYDGTVESISAPLIASKVDVVFHLAANGTVEHQASDVDEMVKSNILYGMHILEAMRSAGCLRIINTGTAWQHATDGECEPANLYAATKQAFEDILKFYASYHGLKALTLKLYDTYGVSDSRQKILKIIDDAARTSASVDLTPGEQLVDFVYVDDVTDCFLEAARHLQGHEEIDYQDFAVSTGKQKPLKEVIQLYVKTMGYDLQLNWGGREYRNREVMRPWDSTDWLPDWAPKVSLQSGFDRIRKFNEENNLGNDSRE